ALYVPTIVKLHTQEPVISSQNKLTAAEFLLDIYCADLSPTFGGFMRKLASLAILLVIVPAGSSLGQTVSPIPPEARAAMQELQKEPFRAHMAFLADDLLEGRGTGKRGHEIAARYVAAQFEAMGLKPAGKDGTYYQRVPLREITVIPEQ